MKNLIENVDLFAHKIHFNYKKKSLYHSFFGLGLSLAVYGTMIFFVWYFSRDFLKNINPKVIYKETEFDKNITIKVSDILGPRIRLYFNIGPNNSLKELPETLNRPFRSEEIGEFFILQTRRDYSDEKIIFFNIDVTTTFIKAKYFNPKGIFYEYSLHYSFDWNSNDFSTLKNLKHDNDRFDLQGRKEINITETDFTLLPGDGISFGFKPHKNFVNNFLSSEYTNSEFFFGFETKDNIINANSEEFFKNYQMYKSSIATKVDNYSFKYQQEKANYGVVDLNNDHGFIITKEEKRHCIKKNYESILEGENHIIYIYEVEINRIMKQYDRIYRKLQNVFADLGGIMSSLILMGNIIIVQFNQKKFDHDLINNVYRSEKDINEKLQMKANLGNLGSNLKEIPNNISIVEMNSSRNFFKKSIIDETLNKNNSAETAEEGKAKINPYTNVYLNNELTNKKTKFSAKNQQIKTFDRSLEIKEKENVLKDKELFDHGQGKEKIEKEGQNPETSIDIFIDNYKSGALFSKPLIYSKSDFFKSFLCCSKLIGDELLKKEKMFNMAQNKIYQYMDVVNHVNSYEKIEKLISIVLNEQQARSFNFILNRQINDIEKENIDRDFIKKIIDYYKENMKESKMSLIDERIVKSISPSISKLIESNLSEI